MLKLNLDFSDPAVIIVNAVIVLFLISEIANGYKKGFLERAVNTIGFILVLIGSYLLKNPLSVFLYTHFPFFKLGGLFKGVSAINILIYEVIAFIIVFVCLYSLLKVINRLTGYVNKLVNAVFIIGLPNKILGALVGLAEGFVILYFVIFAFKFGCNLFGYTIRPSLADNILQIPVLKDTFGDTLYSLDEITLLAKDYDNIKDKDEFNEKAIDILLKYDIITEENLNILIENGKIDEIMEEKK